MPGLDEAVGRSVDEAEMTIVHPISGEPIKNDDDSDMTILVAGLDSSRYKEIYHRQQNARLHAAQRRQGAFTSEKMERDALELLAGCIVKWNITIAGEQPTYNEDAAIQLLTDYKWVREQVDRFVHDRQNFLGNSSTASKSGRRKSSG